jgi:hypothetical protein
VDPDSDSDPDPAIFVIDLQDASKKLIFNKILTLQLKTAAKLNQTRVNKVLKRGCTYRNQGFSYNFCLMIEGSGSRSRGGFGSIPVTSGSGSGRPKNMWIRNTAVE